VEGTSVVAAGALTGRLVTRRRISRRSIFELDMAHASQLEALRVLGRSATRLPDSLPNPALPAGTDTMPEFEHVVVLMLENHSYDNILGMLGLGPGEQPRGDGFALAADWAADGYQPLPGRSASAGLPHAHHLSASEHAESGMGGQPQRVRQWAKRRIRPDDDRSLHLADSGWGGHGLLDR
jgi:hypothetical protein